MDLRKLVKNNALPFGFLDEELLLVPTVKFKGSEVIHVNFYSCRAFENISPETDLFLETLLNDFKTTRSLFESISLNEFFNSGGKYCKKCFNSVVVNVSKVHEYKFIFYAHELISEVIKHMERLKPDADVRLFRDFTLLWSWSEAVTLTFKSYETLTSLRNEVSSRLFADRVSSLETFHSELVTFILNNTEVTNLNSVSLMTEPVESFKDFSGVSLQENSGKVIFDSTPLRSYDQQFFGLKEHHDLLSKILFSPTFTVSKFCVLPAVEFEALKIIVSLNNDATVHREDKIFLENTVTVPGFVNVLDVCETMESLFDKNNETMSNYVTLYDVASTI